MRPPPPVAPEREPSDSDEDCLRIRNLRTRQPLDNMEGSQSASGVFQTFSVGSLQPLASGAPVATRGIFDIPERPREVSCRTEEAFVAHGAYLLLSCIQRKLAESGYAKVVVGLSGGSTPLPIYTALRHLALSAAEQGFARAASDFASDWSPSLQQQIEEDEQRRHLGAEVDWSRVYFFLVDERYVPPDHPDSNQLKIRQHLLGQPNGVACDREGAACDPDEALHIPEANLIFPDTTLPLDECIVRYHSALLELLSSTQSIDLVTLGLGPDAHIASIFPPLSEEQLKEQMNPTSVVLHTRQDRFPVSDRITISLQLLCGAHKKLFFLKGEEKIRLWREMQDNSRPKTVLEHPALAVLQSGNVRVVASPPLDVDEVRMQQELRDRNTFLSVIILGASGDLAQKKTYRALFSLFCEGLLPPAFQIVGYARSKMTFEQLWEKIVPGMKPLSSFFCRKGSSGNLLSQFKSHCTYVSGQYDSTEDFGELAKVLAKAEGGAKHVGRLLYLALPPEVYLPSVRSYCHACWNENGWNRVIVEKPFGRDLETSDKLAASIMTLLQEREIFRIDHYLGKEMALSLIALRFANVAFMPLFHRNYVHSVRITFKEEGGTWGRGGYFNNYGIIRDVMQNHMIQLLTLVAMERPASLKDDDIRDEKVKVLKQMPPVKLSETVLGQFTKSADGKLLGYTDDETVPDDSKTATFCTCVLWINNERWNGVPFIFKAGKALESKKTEVRVQLREAPAGDSFFGEPNLTPNELVILVQPHEAVYLKIHTKKPGLLSSGLQPTELDLSVMDRFDVDRLPDAYERLILDVVRGDKQNFVRTDELREAWRIFTPLLHEIEENQVEPMPYPAGSSGPQASYELIQKYYSYKQNSYTWSPPVKRECSATDSAE
ncbi:glucose-6-phosphate 1-dehydrogenase [Besnoitia besnoiti]|uniref:Glucose-6-phosphate 1-dehydrogenase n=1 Tax=Besnoitia besnoiti TaxID=94643 RepID=A0A2A9M7D1_BESBE|nr:glucose-6-phosphate 1-dehydrogenase [Besnoitia besnoiti]PFH31310.1 glucose-6-phosphate 1-dehydrogenase [Besnoitia besnoiti]